MRTCVWMTAVLVTSLLIAVVATPGAQASGCWGLGDQTPDWDKCVGWHWGGPPQSECIGIYNNQSPNQCLGIDP